MDQGNFMSEPFEFKDDHRLSLQVARTPAAPGGFVQFHIEESKDKTYWVERWSGSVSSGEAVEISLEALAGPWGRLRLETIGGGGNVIVRGFRGKHGS